MPSIIHGMAVIRRINSNNGNQLRVRDTRTDPCVDLIQTKVRRYNQWKFVNIPVIDDLKKFFLSPGCCILSPKIVQYEKRGIANFIEAFFERCILTSV